MKRILTLFICFVTSLLLQSQTIDSLYLDGKITVKINDADSIAFQDFIGDTATLHPDILPFYSQYGLTNIFRPFKQWSYPGCQNTYQFEFSNIGLVDNFIADLLALGYIEFAAKVPIIYLELTPFDPLSDWGSTSSRNWHLKKINAQNAWNINTGGSSVVIAVIDNEIDMSHSDFTGNLWINPLDPIGGGDNDLNGITDDYNGADLADMDGITTGNNILNHGTHCAGLASATSNNGIGISSIGYACSLMPLKATSNASPLPGTIDFNAAVASIYYATSHGADVISCSWAFFGYNATMDLAVTNAISNDIVFVAAAGNNGINIALYPANYTGVIAVAATDENDIKAGFSNYGTLIDVCAPGVNIFSTNSQQIPTAINGYDYKSGTSMATPIVAGLCGLVRSQNPALTNVQVESCIESTATNIDAINPLYAGELGSGRINAPQALLCANPSEAAFFTSDIDNACINQCINFTGFSNINPVDIISWDWSFSTTPITLIGQGTPNMTACFDVAGLVTVTLTLNTIGGPVVYSQTNYLTIGGPTATFYSPANASGICNGSAQELIINFQNGLPPFNYTITNGYTTESFTSNVNDFTDYFYFNADPNYLIYTITSVTDNTGCSSTVPSSVTLTIIDCCSNIIANGDFEQGDVSFLSDNISECIYVPGTCSFGLYSVNDFSPAILPNTFSCFPYGSAPPNTIKNASMGIDCRSDASECGSNTNLAPITAFSTPGNQAGFTSRLWYQQNVNVVAGTNYNIDYFVGGSVGNGNSQPFVVRFEIIDQITSTAYNISGDYLMPSSPNWHQSSFNWTSPFTGLATVQFLQVQYFAAVFYDTGLDDISIRATNTIGGAYAGADLTICNGQPFQLSGSGGPTYSWAPAGTLSNPTIAQPNATPSTTTTYTLTTTNTCGTSTDDVTITVLPFTPMSIVASATTICNGDLLTLSASPSGLSSYQWNDGVNTFFGNPLNITPAATATYTVTGTAANGCTGTATVTISVQPNCCSSCPNTLGIGGFISADPAINQTYCINNNVTITGTVNINVCEIRIAPNVIITIPSGSTLNIAGSHLYSCDDMWSGFEIEDGGSLNIIDYNTIPFTNRSPLIEDAFLAVNIQSSNLTTSILNVSDATFNRNFYDIVINGYVNPILLIYPFTVINSVFTCRDIPFTPLSVVWPTTQTIKATVPVPPLQTPYIDASIFSQTNASAFLKPPYLPSTQKSYIGIYIKSVGVTDDPGGTPVFHEIQIGTNGANNHNIFDNHVLGISGTQSNITCINNVFQNAIKEPFGTDNGIGISASAKSGNYRLRAIPGTPSGNFNNRFFDCTKAINADGYFELIARYNDVRSTQSSAITPVTNHIGEYGILINTNRWHLLDLSHNSLYNLENGIVFNANIGPYVIGPLVSFGGQYSGQVHVDFNTIRPHLPGNTITTQYLGNAIILRNIISSPVNLLSGTNITANSNSISSVYRGIYSTNWRKKNIWHNNNTITLVFDVIIPSSVQFGIQEENNLAESLLGNQIKENNITGPGITTYPNFNAIYTASCSNLLVSCNLVTATTMGIQFAGLETPTRFFANTMSNHHYGYVLSNNGIIGQQGAAGSPSDNKWMGTWTGGNFKTATITSSTSQLSHLYIRTGAAYNPNGSGISTNPIPSIPFNLYSQINGSLITTFGPNPNSDCPIIIHPHVAGGNGSGIPILEKIVTDSAHYTGPDSLKTKYIAKNKVFRLLKDNPALQDSSVILHDFYLQSLGTVKELYTHIEDTVANDSLTGGQAMVSALLPENNIEENYKAFFDIYLKHKAAILLPADSIDLINLAQLCPFTDGDVIYQARALYNTNYSKNIFFEDLCPENMDNRSMEINSPSENDFDVLVYPNPNNGEVFILPTVSDLNSLDIKLFDMNGKEIYKEKLQPNDGLFSIKLSIADGTYLLYMSNTETGEYVTKRIIIKK